MCRHASSAHLGALVLATGKVDRLRAPLKRSKVTRWRHNPTTDAELGVHALSTQQSCKHCRDSPAVHYARNPTRSKSGGRSMRSRPPRYLRYFLLRYLRVRAPSSASRCTRSPYVYRGTAVLVHVPRYTPRKFAIALGKHSIENSLLYSLQEI